MKYRVQASGDELDPIDESYDTAYEASLAAASLRHRGYEKRAISVEFGQEPKKKRSRKKGATSSSEEESS